MGVFRLKNVIGMGSGKWVKKDDVIWYCPEKSSQLTLLCLAKRWKEKQYYFQAQLFWTDSFEKKWSWWYKNLRNSRHEIWVSSYTNFLSFPAIFFEDYSGGLSRRVSSSVSCKSVTIFDIFWNKNLSLKEFSVVSFHEVST